MNKRIKKKKAKQARQQELEQLEQELAKLSPEQLVDIQNAISQVFYEFGKALGIVLDALVACFKNLEVTIEETERQRTQNARRGTVQVPRHPAHHRFTKTGVDNKKSRQPRWSFNRNQQTYRNHRGQARR
ncbi:hypothetical protein [Streptococcus suis]|uniref:Uncharacterized protein n=1 Tax=Streptococcus suis TaxID=1307 RepID=A0AAJ2PFT4_STRSU|nr:hypothetical protein [Streptococcus suis]